jgi:isopenicillin-N epimerase
LYDSSLHRTASFVGADADGFGFVSNATEAIDAVLARHAFRGGDILLGDQAYGAVAAASAWVTRGSGAGRVRKVSVDLPAVSADAIVAAWQDALEKGGVDLAIVDHVTSCTALIQPAAEIVSACRERGVPVLVDGAHAPGMLDLDVAAIDADWYAGNLHKWIGAPAGAGFLWTAPQHRDRTRPLALSHDANEGYAEAFRWQGTRDFTPWLVVPTAIEAIEKRWGWSRLRAWQRDMTRWAGREVASALGTCVADGTGGGLTGAMVSVRLPESHQRGFTDCVALRDHLAATYRVEVAIDDTPGQWWLRLSLGPWARPADVHRLVEALAATGSPARR